MNDYYSERKRIKDQQEGKLEKICLWKSLSLNDDSTTFQSVRETGEEHPLYKCLECNGYELNCNGYYSNSR